MHNLKYSICVTLFMASMKIPMTDPILSPTCLVSTLLGHELRIRMGSKDCRISIRWMGLVCGYICRGIYCFQASISFTCDSAKNKSLTGSVILDAILMSCADWNDTCVCMYVCGKKGTTRRRRKYMRIMHEIPRLELI